MQIREQGVTQAQYSRREVLEKSARTAAVMVMMPLAAGAIEGCGQTGTSSEVYRGPFNELEGRPLITDERFKALKDALVGSGDPLLGKIGKDAANLKSGNVDLSEFPDFVNPSTFPMVITRDMSGQSLAALNSDGEESDGFLLGNESGMREIKFIKPLSVAVNVGSDSVLDKSDPIEESLFLAKETLNLMLDTQVFAEVDQLLIPVDQALYNSNGTPITDRDTVERAGYSVGFREMSAKDSQLSAVLDIAPALIMAPSIIRLLDSGKISLGSEPLGNFFTVADYVMSNPALYELCIRLNETWANSDRVTGPEAFVFELVQPAILDAITAIQGRLYTGQPQSN